MDMTNLDKLKKWYSVEYHLITSTLNLTDDELEERLLIQQTENGGHFWFKTDEESFDARKLVPDNSAPKMDFNTYDDDGEIESRFAKSIFKWEIDVNLRGALKLTDKEIEERILVDCTDDPDIWFLFDHQKVRILMPDYLAPHH